LKKVSVKLLMSNRGSKHIKNKALAKIPTFDMRFRH
jgi:hypothetical protein